MRPSARRARPLERPRARTDVLGCATMGSPWVAGTAPIMESSAGDRSGTSTRPIVTPPRRQPQYMSSLRSVGCALHARRAPAVQRASRGRRRGHLVAANPPTPAQGLGPAARRVFAPASYPSGSSRRGRCTRGCRARARARRPPGAHTWPRSTAAGHPKHRREPVYGVDLQMSRSASRVEYMGSTA